MKQIKRQLIDRALFLYGGLVSFTLTTIAFLNVKSITSMMTLVLFLPVSFYFLIRLLISLTQLINNGLSKNHSRHPYFGDFSIKTFFSQSENTFSINLTLLALATSIILFRISLNILP